jgi:Putative sensor
VTGIAYFVFVVVGLSLSAGFAILIIGVPFFLAFIGIARVIALGEGRLLEGVTGERMPRRPVHPGPPAGWLTRIGEMLKDVHTWTTLLYLLLMLPLGILYFTVAVTWLATGLSLALAPLDVLGHDLGWIPPWFSPGIEIDSRHYEPHSFIGALICTVLGVLLITALMHAARWIARGHARLAKALLVEPGS